MAGQAARLADAGNRAGAKQAARQAELSQVENRSRAKAATLVVGNWLASRAAAKQAARQAEVRVENYARAAKAETLVVENWIASGVEASLASAEAENGSALDAYDLPEGCTHKLAVTPSDPVTIQCSECLYWWYLE